MSIEQNPPVTVITLPPETSTTVEEPVTTTTAPMPPPTTAATVPQTTQPPAEVPVTTAASAEGAGAALTFVFVELVLVAVVVFVVWWFRRRRRPPVIMPPGPSLTERVRAAVEEAQKADAVGGHPIEDVPVTELYPWIDTTDDLTLVVDLRTAEALQEAGVTSLDQLARMDSATMQSMIDAGIEIDARAVEAAAQDILGDPGEDDAD